MCEETTESEPPGGVGISRWYLEREKLDRSQKCGKHCHQEAREAAQDFLVVLIKCSLALMYGPNDVRSEEVTHFLQIHFSFSFFFKNEIASSHEKSRDTPPLARKYQCNKL